MYKTFTAKFCGWNPFGSYKLLLAMKLTFVLLFFSLMQVSASSFAQKVSLSLKEVSLDKAFKTVRKQSGFNILYNAEMLAGARPVTVNIKDASVKEAMDNILKEQGLTYNIIDNNIIISKNSRTAASVVPVTVTGIIRDEKNQPLPGVTIKIKDTQLAVMSNIDGSYKITVPDNSAVLVYSFIGYVTQEVPVGNNTEISITLKEKNTGLNEVVVIGYGTARRAEITSSISSISAKDIKDIPQAGADQMLQGKLAGVTVSNNGGQPGGGVSVTVRGITTINGNEPLYVVDGVILEAASSSIAFDKLGGMPGQTRQSAIAGINPNDIQSIDVLKDASAQAIYGSRAANGVVIITTKRGKVNESKITYDAYYGRQNVQKYLPLMDLSEFAAYNNAVNKEIGQTLGVNVTPLGEFAKPSILGKGTSWQDAIFQQGTIQNHQLGFSGGQGKTTYYLSLNYFDQTGTIIASGYKRYAMRFNLDHEIKPWLKVGLSSSATRNKQRITLTNGSEAVVNLAVQNSPAAPVTNPNGDYAATVTIGGYNFGNANNPVATAELRKITNQSTQGVINTFAEILFNKYLTLKNELNVNYNFSEGEAFQPYVAAADGRIIYSPSQLVLSQNPNLYVAVKNYVNFNRQFGKHLITAQLGHESQEGNSSSLSVRRQNLTLNLESIGAGAAEGQSIDGGKNTWAIESYFARAGYSFDNRYSLNVSMRRDGSSSFGPNKRYGYFPAASVGWTVTNEKFATNWKHLDYLKLRFGAGAVGNQNSGANNYSTNIRLFSTAPFGAGGIPDNVGNPALAWEAVKTFNAGIDAGLLGNRLEFSVDVYKKITTDMLMLANLPIFTGIGANWNDIKAPWVNAGRMTNTGIDVSLTSHNINAHGFTWNTSVVFSHFKNVLNALNSEQSALQTFTEYNNAVLLTRTVPGGPVGRFYGFVTDGLFGSVNEINNSPDQGLTVSPTGTWIGDIKYKDLNGDGKIDANDMTFIGNPNPKFTYGITNTFSFKNFDVSIFLQGSYGGDILNYTRKTTEGLRNSNFNQLKTVTNRFSLDNQGGTLPRYNQWHENNLRISDRFIEDGSYLRIQNVSIGYNLPARWAAKVKMTNAKIFVTGQNLYTFTKYTGYDPELGSYNSNALMQNVDLGNYPNPRSVTIGINTTF